MEVRVAEQPIYMGQWIKGDTLSPLVVFATRVGGSGGPYDLTGLTAAKVELRSLDGYKRIELVGSVVTDGSVVDDDGTPITSPAQGCLRFLDITADWDAPTVGVSEMFECWGTLEFPSSFGFLNPRFTLSFRRAP
jgi:hypothetical protein